MTVLWERFQLEIIEHESLRTGRHLPVGESSIVVGVGRGQTSPWVAVFNVGVCRSCLELNRGKFAIVKMSIAKAVAAVDQS